MKPLTCAATRRRLHAFHDDELTLSDQIAVSGHLEWCDACAASFAELRQLRQALRAASPRMTALSMEEDISLQEAIISRVKAEQTMSFAVRARAMFDDMHLVYAGLGATAATLVCVLIMLSMMRFATRERPDSLAAIVNVLASPGSNRNPFAIDARMLMPRALDEAFSTSPDNNDGDDAAFTLTAVVTREGRIENLELLNTSSGFGAALGSDESKTVESLMDAVSRARFQPARVFEHVSDVDGLPVAVNMVWLVAHTTVRASKITAELPIPRRRTAQVRPIRLPDFV